MFDLHPDRSSVESIQITAEQSRIVDSIIDSFLGQIVPLYITTHNGRVELQKLTYENEIKTHFSLHLTHLHSGFRMHRIPFGYENRVPDELLQATKVLILLWYLSTINVLRNIDLTNVEYIYNENTNFENARFTQIVFGNKVNIEETTMSNELRKIFSPDLKSTMSEENLYVLRSITGQTESQAAYYKYSIPIGTYISTKTQGNIRKRLAKYLFSKEKLLTDNDRELLLQHGIAI